MIYTMECDRCHTVTEIQCSIHDHETKVKPGWPCVCGGHVGQIITGSSGGGFVRDPFPKNDPRWEHVTDDGTPISCKSQLRDLCEQNGNYSRLLEDGN